MKSKRLSSSLMQKPDIRTIQTCLYIPFMHSGVSWKDELVMVRILRPSSVYSWTSN